MTPPQISHAESMPFQESMLFQESMPFHRLWIEWALLVRQAVPNLGHLKMVSLWRPRLWERLVPTCQ